mmetsp:Transcript_37940/g.38629  ORF Transcript_37940/g.38629 Transcript_37940/m.38629 type:complete len:313 (+) Transcript_37940:61-999(+)
MNSFLSSVKKTFGIDKKESTGRTLSSIPTTSAPKDNEYDVTFTSQSLGITITEQDGKPMVEKVLTGSSANRSGVGMGDLIVSIEGNPVSSFEDFSAVIKGLEFRPLVIRFRRNRKSSNSSSAISNAFTNMMPSSSSSPPIPESHLSDEEKEQRRLAMIEAAKIRSKQWNGSSVPQQKKRVETATSPSGTSLNPQDDTPKNKETEQAILLAKQEEERTIKELGYNPFRVHMSSTGEAKSQINTVKHGAVSSENTSDGVNYISERQHATATSPVPVPVPVPTTTGGGGGGGGRRSGFGDKSSRDQDSNMKRLKR